ncbi:TadE/TadG family type IV pilus assembly protein [Candidatus Symbiopectobacterium sp. NZEC135]|uniref:TadE/TadG family type IV pilus assembly protein n=1 Tax=Candidatus Symbiopectobacterium sp. NZEC135 TaxID=2820471 RepID=UPI00222728A8|nr:TadE/TadG family type IV pilus assembly protein [Candidatus Symbiopectobacterium sp. NZEC135]MCW2480014.1 VWA domain-containing protein [Candidatus Symbiopectobacterium sp. NZEC135]
MKIKHAVDFFLLVFRRESGAMTLLFAIMFPMLLMFFSLALDGAHFQANRARLADAMNQGVLAIAINDRCDYVMDKECAVKHGNETANKTILSHYLNYYLPNVRFTDNDMEVIVSLNRDNEKLTSIDYNASGIATLHPIFKKYNEVGFSDNVLVRADSSAGTVRKSMEQKSLPTDFVFVVDVSSSMGLDINGKSTKVENDKKYTILKNAVVRFSKTILNSNEKNAIGIVPFNVGVPVKLNKKDIFGGKETGCSFVGKLKKKYEGVRNKKVDFNFWYNKNFNEKNKDFNQQDEIITSYYKSIVSPALRLTMEQMVNDKKWCAEIYNINGSYSCDADSRANLRAHPEEFTLYYNKAEELSTLAEKYFNVVNVETIDFDETLKDDYLFSDKSVTTYTYFPYHGNDGMFHNMCFDHWHSVLLPKYDDVNDIKIINKIMDYTDFMRKRESPSSYLIELTSSAEVISNFKEMKFHGGETDTSSGLLRSLPVIAKGNNPRKVIIMVTDGEDSSEPQKLATALHKKYHICKRIKEGLLNHNKLHKTVEVDMFFISLAKNGVDGDEVKFWRESCVGDDNAFVVSDYQSLMNILAKIAKKEQINFIDKSDF